MWLAGLRLMRCAGSMSGSKFQKIPMTTFGSNPKPNPSTSTRKELFGHGKPYEAIGCLERLTSRKEPEDPIANVEYLGGVAMLGGIAFKVGRMDDAVRCEKMMFDRIGPDRYARRIYYLPPRYNEFVESLKYV